MADAAAQLQLSVGDRVVYPNQGVYRVAGVEDKEVAGHRLTFVTMRREEDGAVVMVPQAKVKTVGLRKVASREEVGKIFTFLQSDSDKANLDWKQRARTNLDRMSQGGLRGLAEVVKGLQVLSELRPLPNKERELYDSARHLLVAEVAASMGMTECDAEDSVDVALFPPGKERPKRTVAEFKPVATDEDESIDLPDDLLSLGTDLDIPSEEEEEPAADGAEAAEASKPVQVPVTKKSKPLKSQRPASKPKIKAKHGRQTVAHSQSPKAKPAAKSSPAKKNPGKAKNGKAKGLKKK